MSLLLRCFGIALTLGIGILCWRQPVDILVLAVLFAVPFAWLVANASDRHAFLRSFAIGFVPCVMCAGAIELAVAEVLDFALLDHIEKLPIQHRRMGVQSLVQQRFERSAPLTGALVVYLVFTSFIAIAAVEELVKLASVVIQPPCRSWRATAATVAAAVSVEPNSDEYREFEKGQAALHTIVACTLGFATCENFMYTFIGDGGAAPQPFAPKLRAAVIRSAFSTPIHLICAVLTAVELAKRRQLQLELRRERCAVTASLLRAPLPAIGVHGVFDLASYFLTLWLGVEGRAAALASMFVAIGISGLGFLAARAGMRDVRLVLCARQRKGGYGALPQTATRDDQASALPPPKSSTEMTSIDDTIDHSAPSSPRRSLD
jgi:RsiW-degrading membrane proteinase PrsW (M82 family)